MERLSTGPIIKATTTFSRPSFESFRSIPPPTFKSSVISGASGGVFHPPEASSRFLNRSFEFKPTEPKTDTTFLRTTPTDFSLRLNLNQGQEYHPTQHTERFFSATNQTRWQLQRNIKNI